MSDQSESEQRRKKAEYLTKRLPAFKAQIGDKIKAKKIEGSKNVLQPPCCICGSDIKTEKQGVIVTAAKAKLFCKDCQDNLSGGYCAAVTADGKQFCWLKFEGMGDLAGRTQIVSEITMENLKSHYKAGQNAKQKPELN